MEIAVEKGLTVIEDSAQAHLAERKGRRTPWNNTAIFSFFPAKNLGAYGDAGAVVTNDEEMRGAVSQLANHGREGKYFHSCLGTNARFDALQGAILSVKLKHLERWIENKRRLARVYDKELLEFNPVPESAGNLHTYHLYVLQVQNRDRFREALLKEGIETGIHYPIPLHLQPAYASLGLRRGSFPASERMAERILSIPIYAELTDEQQAYIIEKLGELRERISSIFSGILVTA
jgi:dTDP-4-amino-4,6-dideoxygalactose transaminase